MWMGIKSVFHTLSPVAIVSRWRPAGISEGVMAKRAPIEKIEAETEEPVIHPEIRLEASLTIGGRPTARAAHPGRHASAGLAVAAIILSSAAVVEMMGRR